MAMSRGSSAFGSYEKKGAGQRRKTFSLESPFSWRDVHGGRSFVELCNHE